MVANSSGHPVYVLINIVCISHNVSKSYLGNIWHVLIQNIQQEILYLLLVSVICLLAAILENGRHGRQGAVRRWLHPKFVHYISTYLCAKIGAFVVDLGLGRPQ